MMFRWTIWKEQFCEKLDRKHGVSIEDVEQVRAGGAHCRKAEKGRVRGEDIYAAYGRTASGRYLIVFFVFKKPDGALPISARDMTRAERKYYEKKTNKE